MLERIKSMKVASRISLVVSLILLFIIIGNGVYIYVQTKSATENTISEHTVGIAESIVANMDIEEYEKFLKDRQETEIYWGLRDKLNEHREVTNSLYVYTLDITDNSIEILIDGQPKDSDLSSNIGDQTSIITSKMMEPLREGKHYHAPIVKDPKYGDSLSAFAPIKNKEGKVIGALGVDVEADNIYKISESVFVKGLPMFLFGGFSALIISVLGALIYIRRSLKPLEEISVMAEHIANNDIALAELGLTEITIKYQDEVGQLYKSLSVMTSNLKEILTNINNTTSDVTNLSGSLTNSVTTTKSTLTKINKSIETMSAGSERQVSGANESSIAATEMALGIQTIAASASSVSESSSVALATAKEGYKELKQVIHQVETIQSAVNNSAGNIKALSERSQEIETVLSSITDIANQINQLSLNARIEAAKAGDAGKGFAVVANEVRNLSDETKLASRQITDLLKGMNSDTKIAMDGMTRGVQEANTGLEMVKNAGEAFQGIVTKNTIVESEIQEVSAAVEQISASAQQIAATIDEMARIAQSTVTNSNDVKTLSNEQQESVLLVSEVSEKLSTTVSELKTLVGKFTL